MNPNLDRTGSTGGDSIRSHDGPKKPCISLFLLTMFDSDYNVPRRDSSTVHVNVKPEAKLQ